MMSFPDLLQDKDFLHRLSSEINLSSEGIEYKKPKIIPCLYRYSGISEHIVHDIKNNSLTVTAVSEFNDMFDSGINIYSNEEELNSLVEMDLQEIIDIGLDSYWFRNKSKNNFQKQAELKRSFVNNLGAHISCFSTTDSSILMWAHYAKSNTGICIQYDTNTNGTDNLFRKWAFPVAYRSKPINVGKLLYDKKYNYPYRFELAVMISILCKYSIWSYENEWRLISPVLPDESSQLHYQLKNVPQIKEIILGCHFLRNCIDKNAEIGKNNVMQILDYAKENGIILNVVFQDIGKFNLIKHTVDCDQLKLFIEKKCNGRYMRNNDYDNIYIAFRKEVRGWSINNKNRKLLI